MLEDDIQKLNDTPPDHSLTSLENDIWRGVADRDRVRRFSRAVLLSQAAVLALASMGGVRAAHQWASVNRATELSIFSPHTTLAASTLLLRERT